MRGTSHCSSASTASSGRINPCFKGVFHPFMRFSTELGVLLTEPVAPALRAVQRFHTQKLLRSKFMAYVHRLIECMGPAMVPHLSAVLWTLHQAGGDAADACDAKRDAKTCMLGPWSLVENGAVSPPKRRSRNDDNSGRALK